MLPPTTISLSGERFFATYYVTGDESTARGKAEDICIEQTVEFPPELVPDDGIRQQIFGRIESFESIPPTESGISRFETVISFAVEVSGFELTQLLNVLFGNISMKPGIRLMHFELPESLLNAFPGPRFGQGGLRQLLGAPTRPLLATALKPMGYPQAGLAEFAYQFALGGIDIIKDDHGLANQSFAPFHERLERCVEAVDRANRETGYSSIYMPNITGPVEQMLENAKLAKSMGAGGLLVASALSGPDMARLLSQDASIGLPIMSHPAFQGSYVISPDAGISHYALYGQISRLAGFDTVIYPNYGGRFSYSREECQQIAKACAVPMGQIKPIFPAPGGGMNVERLVDMQDVYGNEVIYLIGGALYRGAKTGAEAAENARQFRRLAENGG